jgi:hypothetical protein
VSREGKAPEIIFRTKEELDGMTADQARQVVIVAADNLANQLEPTPYSNMGPYHFLWSDDGLDYMDAATTFWNKIFELHLDGDGQWPEESRKKLAAYLYSEVEQASDGEIRGWIFGPELKREIGLYVDED